MKRAEPTALDRLELDLDTRLLWVWCAAWEVEGWAGDQIAPFIRLAYVNGYRDALTEQQRGKLYVDHGETVPTRMRPS